MATKPVRRRMPPRISRVKRPLTLVGVLLMLLGSVALVHPRVKMPPRKTEVQVIGQKLEIETQRIITIPAIVGGLIFIAGAGLILLDTLKR